MSNQDPSPNAAQARPARGKTARAGAAPEEPLNARQQMRREERRQDRAAAKAQGDAATLTDQEGAEEEAEAIATAPASSPARSFRPAAAPASPKRRHWALLASFVICVVAPVVLSGWYLFTQAADQYASTVGFSVRTEEAGSAIELLGGITEISGSSSSDTDILYQFLQSQELVRSVEETLDLRGMWSAVSPEQDPIFAYHPPGTIEDLLNHWNRMVRIFYDSGTGLIEVRVQAFSPGDAQAIAMAIFEQSSAMINQLSDIAREDAIGYSRDELEEARIRLAEARVALAEWRNLHQTVDPTADTAGQMGLVTSLQAQLANALIELDLLRETSRENDPRIAQAERLIGVIEDRIAAERAVLGATGTGVAFADLVGEFERLSVDLEFAQQSYTAALGAFYSASSEAQRQSRYLAAHIQPTLAERAEYPKRVMLLSLIALFLFLFWTVCALVAYSLRDRR